jgi:hypothetical protein
MGLAGHHPNSTLSKAPNCPKNGVHLISYVSWNGLVLITTTLLRRSRDLAEKLRSGEY